MSLINLLKKKNKKILFTTPSHSQGMFIYKPLKEVYKRDFSETEAQNPQEALFKAENKASKLYGTVQTLFLTNGSTSGIIASVLACINAGDKVLVWENAHPCHHNAIKLAGGIPVLYEIETDENWGVPQKTDPEIIEKYIKDYSARAVIITSPSYEGIVSDIKTIKKICEKYNSYLIVDEAHGALYPFSDKLPESAVKIADFTVQSLHKTAGGLNATALLHTTTKINTRKYLDMINTTSPSYPILASIEENIKYLNSHKGKSNLNKLIRMIENLRKNCVNCEFFGDDITKILVKSKKLSGFELSKELFRKFGIEDEKTNEKSTMLLCGIGTSEKKINKLKNALLKL